MNDIIIDQIKQAVDRATQKHGPMPIDKFFQLAKITEELGEMAHVANDIQEGAILGQELEHEEQYYLEILDTIAVLVRCLVALRG